MTSGFSGASIGALSGQTEESLFLAFKRSLSSPDTPQSARSGNPLAGYKIAQLLTKALKPYPPGEDIIFIDFSLHNASIHFRHSDPSGVCRFFLTPNAKHIFK